MILTIPTSNNGKLTYHPSRSGRVLYCPQAQSENDAKLPQSEYNLDCITTNVDDSEEIIKCLG